MKVQIISVDFDTDIPKADGNGTYKGVLLSYKDLDKGQLKQKGIHDSVYQKSDMLKKKLPDLKKNDVVEFKFQANGKFQNLVDIVPVVKEEVVEAPKQTGWKKADPVADRAKQISICKQSAISQVVNLFIATGAVQVVDDELLDDIIAKADKLVKYTFGD